MALLSGSVSHKSLTVASMIEDGFRARASLLQLADYVSLLDAKCEGDDEGGFRVRGQQLYVVLERGGYRLVAPGRNR